MTAKPQATETQKIGRSRGDAFLLGILRNHEPPKLTQKNPSADIRQMRYMLQSIARKILPKSRVAICSRQPTNSRIGVNYNQCTHDTRYDGLMFCCSVWNCPVCAARITEQRRIELEQGLTALRAGGGDALMVTVTVRHDKHDCLDKLLSGIQDTMQRVKRGRSWKLFKTRHGVVGGVYSLEVTYGKTTGWHPHRHELLMLDHIADGEEIETIQSWLRGRYLKMLAKSDLDASYGNGLTVENDTVDTYIAKFGCEPFWLEGGGFRWTQAHEITKAPAKVGKHPERMTPFVMLMYAFDDHEELTEIGIAWKNYAEVFYGKRQLTWWRGTKALLEVDEISDDDIVNDYDDYSVLGYITWAGWQQVLRLDVRAELLNVASSGDIQAIKGWCDARKIETENWLPNDWK